MRSVIFLFGSEQVAPRFRFKTSIATENIPISFIRIEQWSLKICQKLRRTNFQLSNCVFQIKPNNGVRKNLKRSADGQIHHNLLLVRQKIQGADYNRDDSQRGDSNI